MAEALHNKLNQYLINKRVSYAYFINSIKNIIIIYKIKKDSIKRKDYITRTLIKITINIKNKDFNWIGCDFFKNEESKIIKENNTEWDVNEIYFLIDSINDL